MSAVATYHAVRPLLHIALVTLAQVKAHGREQFATIWRPADNVH